MNIDIENVTKKYGNGSSEVEVLKGISLSIESGKFVVILGASGSGKSTLLNVISGLERADGGKVAYDGKDISVLSDKDMTSFRRDNVGFIFQ